MRRTCYCCDGTGRSACKMCNGKGVDVRLAPEYIPIFKFALPMTRVCENCGGHGRTTCEVCGGKGYLETED